MKTSIHIFIYINPKQLGQCSGQSVEVLLWKSMVVRRRLEKNLFCQKRPASQSQKSVWMEWIGGAARGPTRGDCWEVCTQVPRIIQYRLPVGPAFSGRPLYGELKWRKMWGYRVTIKEGLDIQLEELRRRCWWRRGWWCPRGRDSSYKTDKTKPSHQGFIWVRHFTTAKGRRVRCR